MNIQIISDIHLEFGAFELPNRDCDVLIAAGDIGVGLEGLEWLLTLDMPVVYVAGNHEYWGCDVNQLHSELKNMSKDTNVHFLEKESVEIEGVKFIGCTLWTDFNGAQDSELMEELQDIMNDFRYIAIESKPVTPNQIIDINQKSKQWLSKELTKEYDGSKIVVTHHAPLTKSWASDPQDFLMYAYCNTLDDVMKNHDIELWVHGHIHHSNDYKRHGVRVISNPRGYSGYQVVENFNPAKTVNI